MTRFAPQTRGTLLSGRTALFLQRRPREPRLSADKTGRGPAPVSSLITSPATSTCDLNSVQFHLEGGKKKKKKNEFLNVCFKDLSCAFQVFGCFFSLRVQVHSFSRTFTKKRKTILFFFYALNSSHWAGKTRHYSQIQIRSLISADLELKIQAFSSDFVSFALSCCAIISVVASFFWKNDFVFFVTSRRVFLCHNLLIGEKLCGILLYSI